jgi:predicted glycosyltransferase
MATRVVEKPERETSVVTSTVAVRRKDPRRGAQESSVARPTIWIDLDNSPHVPFFRPIIQELKNCGYDVLVTARDCFQVCGLAQQLQVDCRPIGKHYGKHRAIKLLGLGIRSLQLLPSARRARPVLAVSHGSRSQLVAATMLGVPTLLILDYEFAKLWAGVHPSWAMTPSMICANAVKLSSDRVLTYPGIKEDVYAPSFAPREGLREELGIAQDDILVTLRPPASEAHYHNPDSDTLFQATIAHLADMPEVRMVVLPRTTKQGKEIQSQWPELCASRKLLIPEHVVDGLNLIWHSDLVISGGGTMNREAAALGIPVYSVFRGTMGSVDRYLATNGRLVLLESPADLASKLPVRRRDRATKGCAAGQVTLDVVTNHIIRLAELSTRSQGV